MIVPFMDGKTGMAVYINPAYVVTLRPDPVDLDRISVVKLERSSRFLRVLGDIANKGSLVLGLQTDILHLRKEPLNYDTPTSTSEPSPARPVAPHARPPCNGRPASTPEPSRTRSLRRASLESSVPRVARDRGLPARRPSRLRHRRGGRSTRSGSLVRLLSRRGLQGPSARFDAQDRLVRDPNRPSFA